MLEILVPIFGKLLERIIPDPVERAKAEAEIQAHALAAQQAQYDFIKAQIAAQSELAVAETNQGTFWNSWRPAFAWIMVAAILVTLLVSPLLEAAIGVSIPVDRDLLERVAGWWMAIYMGGHTVKFGVEKLSDAVKARAAK